MAPRPLITLGIVSCVTAGTILVIHWTQEWEKEVSKGCGLGSTLVRWIGIMCSTKKNSWLEGHCDKSIEPRQQEERYRRLQSHLHCMALGDLVHKKASHASKLGSLNQD